MKRRMCSIHTKNGYAEIHTLAGHLSSIEYFVCLKFLHDFVIINTTVVFALLHFPYITNLSGMGHGCLYSVIIYHNSNKIPLRIHHSFTDNGAQHASIWTFISNRPYVLASMTDRLEIEVLISFRHFYNFDMDAQQNLRVFVPWTPWYRMFYYCGTRSEQKKDFRPFFGN